MLRDARRLHLAGKFDEAVKAYESLAGNGEFVCRAAAERGDIDLEFARFSEGIERLRELEKECRLCPEFHVCMAALLYATGDYQGAIEYNRKAISLQSDNARARFQLGQSLERLGRTRDAIEAYRPFDEIMTGDALPDDAAALTFVGLGFYRYSLLTRTNLVQRTRHVLDEVFGHVMDHMDADYWPARLAAAELLLEKHNLSDAQREFEFIREKWPHVMQARVGLGRIHLEEWDFDGCEKQVRRGLEKRPGDVGLLLLKADLRLCERKFDEAADVVNAVLAINPRCEEGLGALAAARVRASDRRAVAATLERVQGFNLQPAGFHYVVGAWLTAGRQFDEAEAHYKKAIEHAAYWSEPHTSLGQLYMETGDEAAARAALEAAFELDPFNQHTYEVLRLLDRLDEFAQRESAHFVLKYDAKKDAVIAPYFSNALEGMYGEVCDAFDVTLDRKTMVEIFPQHEGFSVRVTGRPFIGTIGACTGNVIGMTAPRGKPPFGRFNWKSVLRHEFTHTVTLAATGNRIPHWMTEGLAVHQEGTPRSLGWKQLLADAVHRKRLFTLATIDWGFARPKEPEDRTKAYAQSEWMIEYIIHRWGYPPILDFLRAFREHKSQQEAFVAVLGIPPVEFDKSFAAWAASEVKRWGIRPTTDVEVEELEKTLELLPDDPLVLPELAEACLRDGEIEKAAVYAEKALEQAESALALEVLCQAYVAKAHASAEDEDRRGWLRQARPYVDRLIRSAPDNMRAIRFQGYVHQAEEELPEAILRYEICQARDPEDPDTYRRLAACYLQLGDTEHAAGQLAALFDLVQDEPSVALRLAGLFEVSADWEKAAHWYGRAIEIDPYDAATHEKLGLALLGAKKFDSAIGAFEVAISLAPKEPGAYEGLARVYEAMGDSAQAAEYSKQGGMLKSKAHSGE
ncbi:MAG TPA: tetratricopeptide repeat protein [Phycisphaerae bacterium]|nr:tetratricopeptide repeat protein [Phycisphaerae bacterium]